MQVFEALMAYQRQSEALGQVAGRLGWDQETMMADGSAEQRGEEIAALETILHERNHAKPVEDWLNALDGADLDSVQSRHVAEIRRKFDRASKVPTALAAKIAQVTSVSQGKWAKARAENDFKAFSPILAEVIALRQEEAEAIAPGVDTYDTLLQDYEPGATGAEIEAMFGALRPRLVALREAVLQQDKAPELKGDFGEAEQVALSARIAEVFGYDMNRGRIDKAVHPFASGSGNDVRITTRTSKTNPLECIYSVIHETGHGAYEQNIDQSYLLTPLGRGVSMGVHESQSRIYENQIGRGRAFCGWLYEEMRRSFGDIGVSNPDDFYKAVNAVRNGFIRTEADEVQYNLHVLMRFDLERALLSGALAADDLEEAWNTRFAEDFGFAVDVPANGCLQDVHWSIGLMGYFPTYTLGNVYAGCLFEALHAAVPDLDSQFARGDMAAATQWLGAAVQQHGKRFAPKETIAQACGGEPNEKPLLTYLERKFSELYGL